MPRLNPGTVVASALVLAGVTVSVIDPDGPVGITMFGVAVAAALFLLARPVRTAVHRLAGASPRVAERRRTVSIKPHRRTIALVSAMSGFFAVWLLADLPRPVTYACWWSFCVLAAWLTATTLIAARRAQKAAL